MELAVHIVLRRTPFSEESFQTIVRPLRRITHRGSAYRSGDLEDGTVRRVLRNHGIPEGILNAAVSTVPCPLGAGGGMGEALRGKGVRAWTRNAGSGFWRVGSRVGIYVKYISYEPRNCKAFAQ